MKVLQSASFIATMVISTWTFGLIGQPLNAKTVDDNQSQFVQDLHNNCGNHDHESHDENSRPPKKK